MRWFAAAAVRRRSAGKRERNADGACERPHCRGIGWPDRDGHACLATGRVKRPDDARSATYQWRRAAGEDQQQRQRLAATRQKSTGRRLVSIGRTTLVAGVDMPAPSTHIRASRSARETAPRVVSSGLTVTHPNTSPSRQTGDRTVRCPPVRTTIAAAGTRITPVAVRGRRGAAPDGAHAAAPPPSLAGGDQPPSTTFWALAVIAIPPEVALTLSSDSRYGNCGMRTSKVS